MLRLKLTLNAPAEDEPGRRANIGSYFSVKLSTSVTHRNLLHVDSF